MTKFPIRNSQKKECINTGKDRIYNKRTLTSSTTILTPSHGVPLLILISGITHPNCHLHPITGKRNRRRRPRELEVLPQPLLDLVIPDRHGSIRTRRSEGVESGMEGEGVDGPEVVDVVDGLAVAFERIFFFL